jgi:hypothetical protein
MPLDRVADARSRVPTFNVTLRNAGESDLIPNLGIMLANGRKQFLNAAILLLTNAQ